LGRVTRRVPLSVLELAIVTADGTSRDALLGATELAQAADRLGYERFWVAEHHNMASVASTNPPVLMAHLAARTERIRVGSGGVMLPNHAPLVVAEQIAAIEALHPGRVDLGIGRAPGTDPYTAMALRRTEDLSAEDFPRDLLDLMGLLGDPRPELRREMVAGDRPLWERFTATPLAQSRPQILLLGSSGYSAQLAGLLGLRFVFAHHFDMGGTDEAAELYRRSFRPSAELSEPHLIVSANVLVAETEAEAHRQALPGQLLIHGIRTGERIRLVTPEEAAEHRWAGVARNARSNRIVGTAEQAVALLEELAARTGAAELMVSTVAHATATRVRSLELLADAWGTGAG
jgi:luciferase family oxidoreductase group 1